MNTNKALDSQMAGLIIDNRPPQHPGSIGTTDMQDTTSHARQFGPQVDGVLSSRTSQEPVGDIANLTHEIVTSGEAIHHGSPTNGAPTASSSGSVHGSLAGSSENGSLLQPGSAGSMGYSTVRIRPEKAQYVPVSANWRQGDSTPPQAIPGSAPHTQKTQPATTNRRLEEITTQPWRKSSKANEPSEADHHDKQQGEDMSHVKRKASETESDGKNPKKLVKVAQSGDTPQESQAPLPIFRQRKGGNGEVKQTKAGKNNGKKNNKNNNKNKNRKNQGPQPQPMIHDDPVTTTAPYEAQQTFAPAITVASHLPPYPKRDTTSKSPSQVAPPHLPGPSAHARAVSANEPFPMYRDLMSGPQLATQDKLESHVTPGFSKVGGHHDRSSSSDTASSVTLQSQGLNPGAQNFVLSPPNGHSDVDASSEAKKDGGSVTGSESGKARNESKSGKTGQNETNTTQQGPSDKKAELTTPTKDSAKEGGNDDTTRNSQKVDECETKTCTKDVKPTEKKKDEANADLKRPESDIDVTGKTEKAGEKDTATATATTTTPPRKKKGGKARKTAAKRNRASQASQGETQAQSPTTPTTTSTPTLTPTSTPSSKNSPKLPATGPPAAAPESAAALPVPPRPVDTSATTTATTTTTTPTSTPIVPPAEKLVQKPVLNTKTNTTTMKLKGKVITLAPIPLPVPRRVKTNVATGTNGNGKEVKKDTENRGTGINGGLVNGERKGG